MLIKWPRVENQRELKSDIHKSLVYKKCVHVVTICPLLARSRTVMFHHGPLSRMFFTILKWMAITLRDRFCCCFLMNRCLELEY